MIKIPYYEHTHFVLHNFSSHAILYKGALYPTVEHAYHSQKFDNEEIKKIIRTAKSPLEAKRLANIEHGSQRIKNWQEIKLAVMAELLHAKVEQHSEVKGALLSTGNEEIREESTDDQFWGVNADGVGQNHTGKIFMRIREELRTS
jgi:ribA/ribD-fused uncharacterized protein